MTRRLPLITHESTNPAQRDLWDRIVESRGKALSLIDDDGGLRGPFPPMVQRPHLGTHLLEVGAGVRFGSSLSTRQLEIAICTAGAHWKSEFEFWAHGQLALGAGVEQSVLDALAAGVTPELSDESEQAVHAFAAALVSDGKVPSVIYDETVRLLGHDAVVDLTFTIGYYTLISFTLNTFEAELPPGVDPVWSTPDD